MSPRLSSFHEQARMHGDDAWAIADLRERAELAEIAADRVWRAFWQQDGIALATLWARVDESLGSGPVPTAFVAHRHGTFLGTAALIAHDMDRRPALTPWVAAVWVEPAQRRRGIATALVEHAVQAGFAAGFARIHLCARPAKARFYERIGWRRIERDVDGLDVFSRERGEEPVSSE